MKNCFFFLLLLTYVSNAQNKSTIAWINKNAITIEDANPDTKLIAFEANVPTQFSKAQIFGFGEASHHGKEFFNLKAKFFKHLVEQQGVTLFIMEESYQSERLVNRWISGGEGDASSILNSFCQGIWRCHEMIALLQWMRNYNSGKPYEKQIRFYGMDNQFGLVINTRLRDYIKKNSITIDEKILAVVDSCSDAAIKIGGIKHWADQHLPDLKKVKQILQDNEQQLMASNEREYRDMQRALDYLVQYTSFLQDPYSVRRDRDMFTNVLKILELEGQNSKAFIWAHNEHTNKKELGKSGIKCTGRLLKEHFKDNYYTVGFDFGKGLLKGYAIKNGKVIAREYRTLAEPYKNTFAQTLMEAAPDIYFIDMQKAIDTDPTKFFESKNRQLFLGGPGFDPEQNVFLKRKYTDTYDGLIFIEEITPPTYE